MERVAVYLDGRLVFEGRLNVWTSMLRELLEGFDETLREELSDYIENVENGNLDSDILEILALAYVYGPDGLMKLAETTVENSESTLILRVRSLS